MGRKDFFRKEGFEQSENCFISSKGEERARKISLTRCFKRVTLFLPAGSIAFFSIFSM